MSFSVDAAASDKLLSSKYQFPILNCGSVSTTMTLWPFLAIDVATFVEVVVLPTPPLHSRKKLLYS